MKNISILITLVLTPFLSWSQWGCAGDDCIAMFTEKNWARLENNTFTFYTTSGWLELEGDDVRLDPRDGIARIVGSGKLYAGDYLHANNRLITDGDIELRPNKEIRKRGSASGPLTFRYFNEYNFTTGNVNVKENLYVTGTSTFSDNVLMEKNLKVKKNLTLNNSGSLRFSTGWRPQIKLWGNDYYEIGVQEYTQYFRTRENFIWYRGGSFDKTAFEAGAGGEVDMILREGNLGLGADNINPSTTLDVNGTVDVSGRSNFYGEMIGRNKLNVHEYLENGSSNNAGRLFLNDSEGIILESTGGLLLNGPLSNNISNEPLTINDNVKIDGNELNLFASQAFLEKYANGVQLRMNDPNHNFKVVGNTALDRLSVSETIETKNIDVKPNSLVWPDYVFEENYNLKPLSEVKNYIKKHQHLPEVPAVEEVQKEGYNMAEMDAVLLKKIEELTLYVLQLEEKLKQLESN